MPAQAADVTRVGLREDVHGLLAGPDGGAYVQVSRRGDTDIVRALPDGRVVRTPDVGDLVGGAVGADGSAWYGTDPFRALRVDPAGTPRAVALTPTTGAVPALPLVGAPDGSIWSSTVEHDQLARIAPDGTLTYVPSRREACSDDWPDGYWMTRTADGALWTADRCGGLTREGVQFHVNPYPDGLVADAAGGVWFLRRGAVPATVAHAAADGQVADTRLPRALGAPTDLASAPDGSAFIAFGRCTIARVGLDGAVRLIAAPIAARELAFDGTGAIWLANRARLARGLEGRCRGAAPRVHVPRRVSFASLRRGIPIRVSGRARVTAGTTVNVPNATFSPIPTERVLARAGRVFARVAYADRRRIKRSTTIFMTVGVTDDEGNERGHAFRVRVTR
ncbi:NHL repeat-containing protein [Solirubrobacter deserti]|uniref:Hydrolase n=1 Tax=Solirubrobacter deserti TaxID=2282478 RepID=A0ABT4RH01_9ACTN|nr:hypothetical protein [Solirubrobacter deserti]MDA0137773.1 hypothetical protein [Solirubrobacter deserti]